MLSTLLGETESFNLAGQGKIQRREIVFSFRWSILREFINN